MKEKIDNVKKATEIANSFFTPVKTKEFDNEEYEKVENKEESLYNDYPDYSCPNIKVEDIIEKVNIQKKNKEIKYKNQEISCQILELFTGRKFKRDIRPNFLKNPKTGHNLELDCYNEDLKIALEYNGNQHYIYPNRFMKSEDEMIYSVQKDVYKEEVCKEKGIHLIIVPYTVSTEELSDYISSNLPDSGIYYRN